MDAAFEGLPVAIVHSWDDLTLTEVKKKWEDFFGPNSFKKHFRPSRLYFASWACDIEVAASSGSLIVMEQARNASILTELKNYEKGKLGGVRLFDDCVLPLYNGKGLRELRRFKYP
jgi:hypothetical protein